MIKIPTIVDESCCVGCGACVDVCPEDVYELIDDIAKTVNKDNCTDCGLCIDECPSECIDFE
ncbi:Ferredoxin-2 [subsurface metagenome]